MLRAAAAPPKRIYRYRSLLGRVAGAFQRVAGAATEPLQRVAAQPYPVIVAEQRTALRQAMVAYRGNRYSVPPELARSTHSQVRGEEPPTRIYPHRSEANSST